MISLRPQPFTGVNSKQCHSLSPSHLSRPSLPNLSHKRPSLPNLSHKLPSLRLSIRAIDAAQPFDYESHLSHRFTKSTKLKIAIVGFGNFGQFLAKTIVNQGHTVLAHSRSDYSEKAAELKEFPKSLFLQTLPQEFDILCTHPMFGPESGKESWKGLSFVYDKVRIGNGESRELRCERFLDIFKNEGCRMVGMSCAEHDRHAAGSQFITHTMGRVLEKLSLDSTPINTKGYETLLNLVENTASDSFDLYYGLFMYNKNAMEQLERLDLAFESLKTELFGHLHDVLRKQLFGKAEEGVERPVDRIFLPELPQNGRLLSSRSENANKETS
ncbi:arogenate dehydrogenase 2, chloroplastic-like isoform X2 [Apium graveolens]|uniref:arogenate dehydrogenase 2, chloroplastic-like isoform X2 n=1 Tax=Apium graveolens TaxID=4045 RepID=UPI003D795630